MVWRIHDYNDPAEEHWTHGTFETKEEAERYCARIRREAIENDWPWPSVTPTEWTAPPPAMGDPMGDLSYGGGWLFPDR